MPPQQKRIAESEAPASRLKPGADVTIQAQGVTYAGSVVRYVDDVRLEFDTRSYGYVALPWGAISGITFA